jgi:hypothetical protein
MKIVQAKPEIGCVFKARPYSYVWQQPSQSENLQYLYDVRLARNQYA